MEMSITCSIGLSLIIKLYWFMLDNSFPTLSVVPAVFVVICGVVHAARQKAIKQVSNNIEDFIRKLCY